MVKFGKVTREIYVIQIKNLTAFTYDQGSKRGR